MGEVIKIKKDEIDYEKALIEVLRVFKTLNYFVEAGYDSKTKEELRAVIERYVKYKNGEDFVWEFPFILDSIMTNLIHLEHCLCGSEFSLHKKFRENVNILIPGSKIFKHKDNKAHHPDFWIDLNGEVYPVEIKLQKFDNMAKRQLLRYMYFYKKNKGFAVAPILKTELPENITFIELSL